MPKRDITERLREAEFRTRLSIFGDAAGEIEALREQAARAEGLSERAYMLATRLMRATTALKVIAVSGYTGEWAAKEAREALERVMDPEVFAAWNRDLPGASPGTEILAAADRLARNFGWQDSAGHWLAGVTIGLVDGEPGLIVMARAKPEDCIPDRWEDFPIRLHRVGGNTTEEF